MKEVREERVEWKSCKWDQSATDWKAFGWAKRVRSCSWQPRFGAKQDGNSLGVISNHFKQVFTQHEQGRVDAGLQEIKQSIEGHSPPFQEWEVDRAVRAGKLGKSVGADQVSQELLIAIVDCEGGLAKLTDLFISVLSSGVIPPKWNSSILALLPKTSQPESAKQLRPIALNSHTSKTFARAFLMRMGKRIENGGAACRLSSSMWRGRLILWVGSNWGPKRRLPKAITPQKPSAS